MPGPLVFVTGTQEFVGSRRAASSSSSTCSQQPGAGSGNTRLLSLLEELAEVASPPMQKELQSLAKQVRLALPHLLLFATDLDEPLARACAQLGQEALHLIAWAWQRRAFLGPSTQEVLEGVNPTWREAACLLLQAWEQTVRASSAVENWHSVVRPHLAVHRTLSAGMLSLLAVRQNHHVAPRGVHQGLSPLQWTGYLDPPTDWLVALGYSPMAS